MLSLPRLPSGQEQFTGSGDLMRFWYPDMLHELGDQRMCRGRQRGSVVDQGVDVADRGGDWRRPGPCPDRFGR